MATIPISQGQEGPAEHLSWSELRPVLLACGILAALFYAAMVGFVAMSWPEYDSASQTISELSAIGAPTRDVWVALGVFYTLLVLGFGRGVWLAAGRNRRLRVAGGLIIASGVIAPFWPPMHLRGAEPTLTDTLHIVFAVAWNLLAVLTVVAAAAGLGRRFRIYSVVTLVILAVFGTLTGMAAPRIAANLPTPWVGVWERILVAAFMLWMTVLAVVLLRASLARVEAAPPRERLPDEGRPMAETPVEAREPAGPVGAGAGTA